MSLSLLNYSSAQKHSYIDNSLTRLHQDAASSKKIFLYGTQTQTLKTTTTLVITKKMDTDMCLTPNINISFIKVTFQTAE